MDVACRFRAGNDDDRRRGEHFFAAVQYARGEWAGPLSGFAG